MKPTWLKKHPVLKDKDIDQLETEAAIHEFGPDKTPRDQAEKKAYDGYVRKQRENAVAWHAVGQKLALANGDSETAKKHGEAMEPHLKALGHDGVGPLPKEIEELKEKAKVYKFRNHPGDSFNESEEELVPKKDVD